jgi:hypothetical protein
MPAHTAAGDPWTNGCQCVDEDTTHTGLDLLPGPPLRVRPGTPIPDDPYFNPNHPDADKEPW